MALFQLSVMDMLPGCCYGSCGSLSVTNLLNLNLEINDILMMIHNYQSDIFRLCLSCVHWPYYVLVLNTINNTYNNRAKIGGAC